MPSPDGYHEGLKAGQLSQPGFILKLMLPSLVEQGSYDDVSLGFSCEI
ncbi:hypothetical protein SAMN05216417_12915 [Nitrosospira multiformis]|uniref:Uncharacterized protein n=1 Tax=Nitrosospira multiformis TaxID=1231 RepID=A0A1I7IWF2_9PROT|nr:hypothetical protein SAMN05216417_12915 [Nitrosospira multiformis]